MRYPQLHAILPEGPGIHAMLKIFLVAVVLVAGMAGASAQGSGNLPADFYAASGCKQPEEIKRAKPAYGDQAGVDGYNAAVRRYNNQSKAFAACSSEFSQKASADIQWILFTVNSAIAKATGKSPPSPPAAPGNMPAGFYPAPVCIAPEPVGAAPDGHDLKAMAEYNARVRAYNAMADGLGACLKDYSARAQADIARIKVAEQQ